MTPSFSLAVVTHGGGKELEESLVVRPTSETIIYDSFSRWIKSYRDLPMAINQWANVVRWEKKSKLFLRTTEFLWQEGHTGHADMEEARKYTLMILHDIYKEFAEKYLAMPVYEGKKAEAEKFAGAEETFCIEALMQDGKSLQAGTSHYLADNFSKSFNVCYLDHDGKSKNVFQTSWGVSTRLIGGIIMTHSDDKGLVLPPKIAPVQIVVIPIAKSENDSVMDGVKKIVTFLSNHRIKVDKRFNLSKEEKKYSWEKKGVPLRIEFDHSDLASGKCVLARRDSGEKIIINLDELKEIIPSLLNSIQEKLFYNAYDRREESNKIVDNWNGFAKAIKVGGYVFAHWCEDDSCQKDIKDKTKAITRFQPLESQTEDGVHLCINCGKISPSKRRWVFAMAY